MGRFLSHLPRIPACGWGLGWGGVPVLGVGRMQGLGTSEDAVLLGSGGSRRRSRSWGE